MNNWKENIFTLNDILKRISVFGLKGDEIFPDAGFEEWKESALKIREKNGVIFFAGNGASASMASHFATDLAKNGRIRTQTFTDLSLITALANDICYEEVYAEPLRWYMKKGDMLVAISSSGNSGNIVRAVNTAKNIGGRVVTISAMKKDNKIKKLGDINFYVPAKTYGLAETAHGAILHYWMDLVEGEAFKTF